LLDGERPAEQRALMRPRFLWGEMKVEGNLWMMAAPVPRALERLPQAMDY
jgi:hypothetical protein